MSFLLNEKHIVTGKGLFDIYLQCPRSAESGSTVRFTVKFFHAKDGLVNPTGLTAQVYEGRQHSTMLATLTPEQDDNNGGKGHFFAEWDVPATQGSGPVIVVWSGTYVSSDDTTQTAQPVQASIGLRITNPWR